jgi:hypothetical protein
VIAPPSRRGSLRGPLSTIDQYYRSVHCELCHRATMERTTGPICNACRANPAKMLVEAMYTVRWVAQVTPALLLHTTRALPFTFAQGGCTLAPVRSLKVADSLSPAVRPLRPLAPQGARAAAVRNVANMSQLCRRDRGRLG